MLALSFTVFLDLVGFGMILPLLPFYAASFGASPFEIGLLFASYSLAQFFGSPTHSYASPAEPAARVGEPA